MGLVEFAICFAAAAVALIAIVFAEAAGEYSLAGWERHKRLSRGVAIILMLVALVLVRNA